MTIQIPNPGTGNGQTGDNEYVLWSKVKDNFNDQTNAASRLVGSDGKDKIPAVSQMAAALYSSSATTEVKTSASDDANNFPIGKTYSNSNVQNGIDWGFIETMVTSGNGLRQRFTSALTTETKERIRPNNGTWSAWHKTYTEQNTTKDANGFIKAASPIVKVHADKVVLNADAENQEVTYVKNGVGDYTINTQSGLSTDGWYIELPKDMNGNPKVAVTLDEVDGVITLKSYKRIFSMETFTFVPDLNEPLDIPDGRWVDLRLNEIPTDEV